ncbi:putative Glucan 1,3-beta-glucosidase [Diplocarpon rosae]|nr:putative Glucan 1,3-beta-glucosidase [Diplocarpon rosae]
MGFLHVYTLVAAIVSLSASKPLGSRALAFDYDSQKVRGVNLGGWFVLEPWITPSIFSDWANGGGVVDEYTYTATLGKSEASRRLEAHWSSWITEADFSEMASFGLNHVRIPIGYWALAPLAGDPYVQGQLPYLDQAMGWARKHGLKVMLDLHGAPGSQNGFDNSGKAGSINWQSGDNVKNTLTAIRQLAERYASQTDVVTAIQLLNEPANWGNDISTTTAGDDPRLQPRHGVVIHDAFLDPSSYWNGFMNQASGVNHIILDTHIYQIFSPGEVARKPCEHVQVACAAAPRIKDTDKWTIVGEWTGAQTDCAKWLNGLGKGARYDGSFGGATGSSGSCQTKSEGTVAGLLDVDKVNMEYYIEAQLDAYEQHSGWIFWAWKTESAPEWHFRDLTRAGIIPQPLTSRKHPAQCGTAQCLIPGN